MVIQFPLVSIHLTTPLEGPCRLPGGSSQDRLIFRGLGSRDETLSWKVFHSQTIADLTLLDHLQEPIPCLLLALADGGLHARLARGKQQEEQKAESHMGHMCPLPSLGSQARCLLDRREVPL